MSDLTETGLLKIFSVCNRFFVYDCIANRIFEIKSTNNDTNHPIETANAEDDSRTKDIFLKNFLTQIEKNSSKTCDISFNESNEPRIIPRTLEFVITGQCNMACRYCATRDRYISQDFSYDIMDEEVVIKAIDLLKKYYDNGPLLTKFFGGEPLLGFNIIKKVIHCLKESRIDSEMMIATNGLLLNKEIIDFLAENDFLTFISLDGPKEVHDTYRKDKAGNGTYTRVVENLMLVKKLHPNYFKSHVVVNMVVAPEYSGKFSENLDHLMSLGLTDDQIHPGDTAPTRDACTWYNTEQVDRARSERAKLRRKLVEQALKGDDSKQESVKSYCQFDPFLGEKDYQSTKGISSSDDRIVLTDCQSLAWNILTFWPDGKVSACIEFPRQDNLVFGDLKKEELYLDKLSKFKSTFRKSIIEGKCAECWAVRFCVFTGCYKIFADTSCKPDWQDQRVCDPIRSDIQDRIEDYLRLKIINNEL